MADFEIKLEKNINERISALFEIERALFTSRYKLSRKHSDILTVHSISMIYATWEGFIQTSFNELINELNNMQIDSLTIKDELFLYHIEKTFPQFFEYPDKPKKRIRFLTDLGSFFKNDTIQLNMGITIKQNISFEVLNSLLNSFCLPQFPEYWDKYSYPNSSLKQTMSTFIRYRNGVAHGGDISSEEKVTQDVFSKYRILVTDLMTEIQIRMINSIENQLFLKSI